MGRALLLSMIVLAGCRGGDEPAIPDPAPAKKPLAIVVDAGTLDAAGGPGTPPGSGGTPVAMAGTTASCPDPLVGVWVAKTFADQQTRWNQHRLSIARDGDGELVVSQTTHIWSGGADATLPPVCPSGGPSWGVFRMTDKARFVDGILHIWGTAVVSSEHTCGGDGVGYNLDSFTGRVSRDSYTARNNDGADAVNRPYLFRRVTCTPD